MRRISLLVLGAIAAMLAVAFVALVVLSGTDYGRDRARRLALDALRGMIHGDVTIGRIEGNLLDRFTLVDVAIAGQDGRPFLSAERVSARVALAPLLSKRILIPELRLEQPLITLAKSADGTWNYERIFPRDTSRADTTLGFGSWVELRDVGIDDGTLVVQQPYPTDETMSRATRDSLINAALAGRTRLRVERVDGGSGLRQTMEFRQIDAVLPRAIVANPDSGAMTLRIGRLSMLAAPFQPPELAVRDLRGDVRAGEGMVALRDVALRLPDSRMSGDITYHVEEGDVDLRLESDTVAFADLRVLYPPLPERGGGRLDLKAAIRQAEPSEVEVSNARLGVDESRVSGRVGLVMSPDTLQLRGADLRFTRFSTALVERLVPGTRIRLPGAFTGRAQVEGPLAAMRVAIDGRFDPTRHPAFQVAARGLVGAGHVMRAESLRVSATAVPVSLARDFVPDFPVAGTLDAEALIDGTSATRLVGHVTVTHHDRGAVSRIVAGGTVAPDDSMRTNVNVRLVPVSMELAQAFVPRTDLRGVVTGTGHLRGTAHRLLATLALRLPAGMVDAEGIWDRTTSTPFYDATLRIRGVDPSAIAPTLPVMALNGTATVAGRGIEPATMNARASLHLRDIVVDSAQVGEVALVAGARDARLVIDTLRVRAPFGVATAAGTLGLTDQTEGTIDYRVDLSTLSGLQRWIATGDTGLVYPRPAVRRSIAVRAARADSLRQAQVIRSGDLGEIIAKGEPWLRRAADIEARVAALNRDSIAGTVRVRGTVTGRVQALTARARAAMSGVVWGGNEMGRGTLDVSWAGIRTPRSELRVELGVDSLRAAGFAFDSTHIRGTYRDGTGGVVLAVYPGDTAAYQMRAEYALRTGEGEVRVQDVSLRFDSVTWVSAAPSAIRWRGRGITVDSLELRMRDAPGRARHGRIFVNGEIPDRDPGRLEIVLDSVSIAPWLSLAQSTLPASALANARVAVEGTRSAPRISGSVALVEAVYNEVPFPELRTEFDYGGRRLRFDGSLRRAAGLRLANFAGSVPLDLSFGDSVSKRLAGGALDVTVEGDSIPLGPVAELVDALSALEGEARGRVMVRGTWEHPRFEGALAVDVARAGIEPTGVTFTGGVARLRMTGDRLMIDTLVAHNGGTIRGSGQVSLADASRPVVDLRLDADEARVLDNEMGQLVIGTRLRFRGPLDTLSIGGSVTVDHGVIRIPDPEDQKIINTGDPALFAVVDTALARELEVAPASRRFAHARVNVTLTVQRGTWARSPDANVEIYGELDVERGAGDEEVEVTGALYTDYGEYTIYGRRFDVSRGSVRFTGPGTNPVLQVLATHEVRQAGRAPFDIQVTIGGTLKQPNISLDSQAQPTLTQSDLIAFLAFGRSSTSLLQLDGSGLEGGGMSGSSLAGNVAATATRQLAAVGLGALAEEAQKDLLNVTAADVLEIRPAELPPGLSIGAVGALLSGTEIVAGKYLDQNTFLVAQFRPTLAVPGATLERRFGSQLSLRASLETRYLPQRPSLTRGLRPDALQVFGAMLRWSRGW